MNPASLTILRQEPQSRNRRSLTIVKGQQTPEERFLLLISRFEREPSEDCAIAIFKACDTLLNDGYKNKFNTVTNIICSHSTNAEQFLWKNVFYCVIEVFRKVTNADSTAAKKYKILLTEFVDQAIKFYLELIRHYETLLLPWKFNDIFYWAEGSSPFCVNTAFIDRRNIYRKEFATGDMNIMLRSAQRHFLAIGDLYRYKSNLIDTQMNTKLSRKWYFNAAQISLHNGRAFNQLGVLGSQSRNFLDMIFYYVAALAAKYPFNSARESLGIACNQIQQIPLHKPNNGLNGKPLTPKRTSKSRLKIGNDEIWIRPDDSAVGTRLSPPPAVSQPVDVKTQRVILLEMLHLAGILLTNIGMEKFKSLHDQALLHDLPDLINAPDSILTTTSLLKVALIFMFTSHYAKPGATESTAGLQRLYATRIVLDLLSTCITVALEALTKLKKTEENTPLRILKDSPLYRVLPTLCALNQWFIAPSKPTTNLLAAGDPLLDLGRMPVDYALLLDIIQQLRLDGRIDAFERDSHESDNNVELPDQVLMSSFYEIFPSPIQYHSAFTLSDNGRDLETLTFHCRLNAILLETEHIFAVDESNVLSHLTCLSVEQCADGQRKFRVRPKANTSPTGKMLLTRKLSNNSNFIGRKKSVASNDEDDELVKKNLIGDRNASQGRKVVFEIRPKYLVPDTNTFIDHLELIKRIVNSKKYTVLVPTIVVTELTSLSTDAAGRRASGIVPQKLLALLSPELGPKSKERNVQMQYVMRQASATLAYLRQAAQERIPNLVTITTNGNILTRVSFAHEINDASQYATNDDRILASCIELCNNEDTNIVNGGGSSGDEPTIVRHNTVFLSEDRALCIKAVAAKVPTRSAPQFLRWSGI